MRVEAHGICRSFGHTAVLHDVTFTVEAGQSLAVCGPSGIGKTTLLKIIAGLERLEDGIVKIDGEVVSGGEVQVAPNRRGVNMVFQDFALWPHMTAEKHLHFVLRSTGMSRCAWRKRAQTLLEIVDLADHARKYPNQLSGGQQQRLAIARALAPQPKVLLLDEPFSNLDEALTQRVREYLQTYQREYAATYLFATLDGQELDSLAHRVYSF